jgi:adenylylsulfate kinase
MPIPARVRGATVWLTGLPSAGKSTLAGLVADGLSASHPVEILDGDEVRRSFFPELGFSPADRDENVHRVGRLALLLARHDVTVLVAVIAPYRDARDRVRQLHAQAGVPYAEVWVDAPVDVCAERDVKGLYAMACRGELTGLTGVDGPYEPPTGPELHLRTDRDDVVACTAALARLVDRLTTGHLDLADR